MRVAGYGLRGKRTAKSGLSEDYESTTKNQEAVQSVGRVHQGWQELARSRCTGRGRLQRCAESLCKRRSWRAGLGVRDRCARQVRYTVRCAQGGARAIAGIIAVAAGCHPCTHAYGEADTETRAQRDRQTFAPRSPAAPAPNEHDLPPGDVSAGATTA